MTKSKFVALAIGTLGVSGMAQARYVGPLLAKEARTGNTLPELVRSEKCEIFADRVVQTIKFGSAGSLQSVKTIQQSFQGDSQGLLQKASKGNQAKYAASVDGNSVRHFGFVINANDTTNYVGLYYENTAIGELIINQSPEARLLKNVIDSLCPDSLQGSDAAFD